MKVIIERRLPFSAVELRYYIRNKRKKIFVLGIEHRALGFSRYFNLFAANVNFFFFFVQTLMVILREKKKKLRN